MPIDSFETLHIGPLNGVKSQYYTGAKTSELFKRVGQIIFISFHVIEINKKLTIDEVS